MNEPSTWMDGMATETGRWPHNTGLPGGSASQRNEIDDHSQKADRGGHIHNLINAPLPWVCLFALILIAYIWIDSERRADLRVQLAEASIKAELANQRITDSIASQAQVQIAYEQTLKYYTGEVVKAQTETRMLEYYVGDLTSASKAAKVIPIDYSFEKFKQQQRGK